MKRILSLCLLACVSLFANGCGEGNGGGGGDLVGGGGGGGADTGSNWIDPVSGTGSDSGSDTGYSNTVVPSDLSKVDNEAARRMLRLLDGKLRRAYEDRKAVQAKITDAKRRRNEMRKLYDDAATATDKERFRGHLRQLDGEIQIAKDKRRQIDLYIDAKKGQYRRIDDQLRNGTIKPADASEPVEDLTKVTDRNGNTSTTTNGTSSSSDSFTKRRRTQTELNKLAKKHPQVKAAKRKLQEAEAALTQARQKVAENNRNTALYAGTLARLRNRVSEAKTKKERDQAIGALEYEQRQQKWFMETQRPALRKDLSRCEETYEKAKQAYETLRAKAFRMYALNYNGR